MKKILLLLCNPMILLGVDPQVYFGSLANDYAATRNPKMLEVAVKAYQAIDAPGNAQKAIFKLKLLGDKNLPDSAISAEIAKHAGGPAKDPKAIIAAADASIKPDLDAIQAAQGEQARKNAIAEAAEHFFDPNKPGGQLLQALDASLGSDAAKVKQSIAAKIAR
jgi:hypothetical protein